MTAGSRERTIGRLRARFEDELRTVTERHATTWQEACDELAAAGFARPQVLELVRHGYAGLSWDLERLTVRSTPPGAGAVVVPKSVADGFVSLAAELRGRTEALLRHPAGRAAGPAQRRAS